MNIVKYHQKGYFKVTTEGDCEGRSVRDLGTHYGYLDDIALALADKCYYALCFKWVDPSELNQSPKAAKVAVSLDIDSGTWNMSGPEKVLFFKSLLKDRPVNIGVGQYYASIELTSTKPNLEKDLLRKAALSKLTLDERKILGLV